ncbi:uncharacterized protein EKO05_0008802 [Ascochyta rabiei]|uniref:Uncharacterized protein n=1 Tax=Didymella rabiei TaxID=5454 RepID=A0A163JYG0_DIDRA|nr:uncharacterized protein EKO05_0008802 [Ascochyta rabiei]KZM26667.1 hypothetical protein ST47_g2158 [Ascochyta rabiei]UPX18503.1 hypothetical protein EKO05_0008802 [Ascochyta rabiei]
MVHGDGVEDTPTPPQLTDRPTLYAGCCLALSKPLVAHVHSLLPPAPALTLSIGSGFGLLEAHLAAAPYHARIVGVEVEPSPNTYLPAARHRIVHGTRFLEPLAAEASAWLFVYPRRVGLVDEYLAAHGRVSESRRVHVIVWIGPQADWDDYARCFTPDWKVHIQSADAVGGKPWELIATANRAPP